MRAPVVCWGHLFFCVPTALQTWDRGAEYLLLKSQRLHTISKRKKGPVVGRRDPKPVWAAEDCVQGVGGGRAEAQEPASGHGSSPERELRMLRASAWKKAGPRGSKTLPWCHSGVGPQGQGRQRTTS